VAGKTQFGDKDRRRIHEFYSPHLIMKREKNILEHLPNLEDRNLLSAPIT